MSRIAFVFPGQGSQVPGMRADLLERHPEQVRPYFETADEVLQIPLSKLCFEGDSEDLRDTSVTQPAVYLVSLVAAAVLREQGVIQRADHTEERSYGSATTGGFAAPDIARRVDAVGGDVTAAIHGWLVETGRIHADAHITHLEIRTWRHR